MNACKQKMAIAKRAHEDSKTSLQQCLAKSKEAQKRSAVAGSLLKKRQTLREASAKTRGRSAEAIENEKAATRIEDTIGSLRRVAEHRRSQVEQMKKPTASRRWIQSFPDIPGAMKRSIWHKLHRRRHHIVLRPSCELMIHEIRMAVTQKVAQKHPGLTDAQKVAVAETERLKAERLFLLATHPAADGKVSPFPPQRSLTDWGEPGWQLDLSVPNHDSSDYENSPYFLRRRSFPVFEQNLAEMMSSPGRQAACYLRPHTTRCLSSPLSAFSIASSPAEEATVLPTTSEYLQHHMCHLNFLSSTIGLLVESDLFNISGEMLESGYTFTPPQPKQSNVHSKKRSASNTKDSMQDSSSSSKHTKSSLGASPLSQQSRQQDQKKPSSPRRVSQSKKPSPKTQKNRIEPAPASLPPPLQTQQPGTASQQQPQQLQQQKPQQSIQQQATQQTAQQLQSNQHHRQQNPQQQQQQQQPPPQQQVHHSHMAQQHNQQQLMQQQAQMGQQQAAAMLQRYPQQYSTSQQMAQLRMIQQQAVAAAAGSPRHQFPFYNPIGHSGYPAMAMQHNVHQPPNPSMHRHQLQQKAHHPHQRQHNIGQAQMHHQHHHQQQPPHPPPRQQQQQQQEASAPSGSSQSDQQGSGQSG